MIGLADTLLSLVQIHSVSGSEGHLATAVTERLLPSQGREGIDRIGNNLVVGRRTGRPLLMLAGHLDTVPAQGDNRARIEGDRLYGLGASDMKAGLTVMIHLLEDPEVRTGPYDVIGVFYDMEEGPAERNGLGTVLEKGPWLAEAEFAVVLEPTGLEVQLGCVGGINARASFLGRGAHSARPWLGVNAITRAGEWLAAMNNTQPVSVWVGGLEFKEVMSVTTASGGVASNVIPARFDLNVNYRFPPGMSLAEAEGRLLALLAGVDEVTILDGAPAGPVPEESPHLVRLMDLCAAPPAPKQGWTDVARLAQVGVPAANYGPGDPDQAHQANESAPVAALEQAFSVLKRLIVEV